MGYSVKSLVVFCSMAVVLLASFQAVAQQPDMSRRLGQDGPPRQPPQRVPVRDAAAQDRNAGRPMQMTPEQRQQLRRDIHDHGRDIYRERGKGGRRR